MVKMEISEYEEQRKANIAERDVLLKKLSLEAAGAGLVTKSPKPSPSAQKSQRKKKPQADRVKQEAVPRRTSSRIAGLEADSEKVKRKAEEEYQAAQEVERIKRQRVSADLNLDEIVVAGREWREGGQFFTDVVRRGARPYERTFGDTEVKSTTDKELKSLREKMSGLEIYGPVQPNRIKITPERIYSMGFHPEPDKAIVFAGDKLGNLGIFDSSQTASTGRAIKDADVEKEVDDEDDADDEPEPAITTIHLHTRTISSFQFSPVNPSHLLTCSYDSSVRLMDFAVSKSAEVYGPADKEADEPLSGLEIDPHSPHVIYFSRLDGHLGRHDTREGQSSSTTVWQLSEKKVGGFSIHPQYPHFLTTASLDRIVRLWDLRKMERWEGTGKRPALLGEHTSRLSVSHAAFNSVGQVATSSYDDTIKIYNFQKMNEWEPGAPLGEEAMEPSTIIKHNNQTGRWVTILRPQWQSRPSDGVQRFAIGNMNRFVDIYSGDGTQLAQLGSDDVTAVPAVAQFHPTRDWVAGGTASGKLCLWM